VAAGVLALLLLGACALVVLSRQLHTVLPPQGQRWLDVYQLHQLLGSLTIPSHSPPCSLCFPKPKTLNPCVPAGC
jgi:hypothetical protein